MSWEDDDLHIPECNKKVDHGCKCPAGVELQEFGRLFESRLGYSVAFGRISSVNPLDSIQGAVRRAFSNQADVPDAGVISILSYHGHGGEGGPQDLDIAANTQYVLACNALCASTS